MADLSGRCALVTGASGPIGAQITRRLVAAGARVALTGRQAGTLHAVADSTADVGRTLVVPADLTSADDVTTLRAHVEAQWAPVELLVACAGGGGGRPAPLADVTDDGWAATLATNLTSMMLTLRTFVPAMMERGQGAVVAISSDAALTVGAASVPYTVAKAAVLALARQVAGEAAPHGVRVNAIAPGSIRTPEIDDLPDDIQQRLAASHPSGRMGTPDDVADTTLYLLGDESTWLTGEVLTPGARSLR